MICYISTAYAKPIANSIRPALIRYNAKALSSLQRLVSDITKALEISVSIRINAKGIFTKIVQNHLVNMWGISRIKR